MLFRCSDEMFKTIGTLDAISHSTQAAEVVKHLGKDPAEHATACCAWQLLREMYTHTSNQAGTGEGSSQAARWSTKLIDRLRQIRLRSPHAMVNLHDPEKSLIPRADSLCALSLDSILQMEGLLGPAGSSPCSSSCTWSQLRRVANSSSKPTGRVPLSGTERQRAPSNARAHPAAQPRQSLGARG